MVILLIAGCDWPVDVKQQMGDQQGHPRKARIISAKPLLLQLDFDVHTSRQVQLHQRINGLVSRIDNIHQTKMGTNFELITGSLVDVRRTQDVKTLLASRQRTGPRTTAPVRLAVSTIS
jgi:hypothetical protein